VSSTYNILCVSHDPAILIETDEQKPAVVIERVLGAGVPGHPGCDLMVGRYSYPLIELCCVGFPFNAVNRPHPGWHRDPEWAEAGLLRVAAVSLLRFAGKDPAMDKALLQLPMCWTRPRLVSLRDELQISLIEVSDPSDEG
jgi:hypothetical protein